METTHFVFLASLVHPNGPVRLLHVDKTNLRRISPWGIRPYPHGVFTTLCGEFTPSAAKNGTKRASKGLLNYHQAGKKRPHPRSQFALSPKTTIIIADDHPSIRHVFRDLLNEEADFEVVAEVTTANEALESTASLRPTIVILDIDMPGIDAFQAASEIRQISSETEVIFLSGSLNDHFIDAAKKAGAMGYVVKNEPMEEVINAIRMVLMGQSYYSPSVRERLLTTRGKSESNTRLSSLSTRELETLRYIARGLSKKEIAPKMHISVKTVDKHVTQVMDKLGIHDRVELARFAIKEGIVEV